MKVLILSLITIMLVVSPVMAIDIDQINVELKDNLIYAPIVVEAPKDEWSHWNNWDTGLLVLRVADWLQTRDIATRMEVCNGWAAGCVNFIGSDGMQYRYDYRFSEANPLIGEHPTLEQVNNYFAKCITADFLIAKYANPTIHRFWNIIGITLESWCINHNIQAGVSFKF